MYLSYKSTTAYNWLGYTYLIARSYLHDVGQGIKAVHEQEESRMERSNEKQRGIRIFASSICRFFLISLVEAIQPISWWSILFLHCELYHHLLRLPLPDNSLIMMLTVPPLMQRIFWRPFFSSVPPISTPLHARQELNLELYFLLVMFFLSCFWIDQFSVDGTGTWQGSLEKAKTRTGAHIHDELCVRVWWTGGQ